MIRMPPSMLLLVVLCACAAPPPTVPDIVVAQEDPNRVLDVDYLPEIEPFDIDRKRVYYTRVNFWYEFLRHKTTNYSRGQLVPINSRVTLKTLVGQQHRESRKPEIFDLRVSLLDSETRIAIWNVEHYSRASMYEIIYRMFSPEPVNLEVFDEEMQAVIESGELRVGMTRYQTLLARGYPPGHRTPSLESDQWVYWSSRHQSDAVNFVDGRLVAVVDIEQPPLRVPLPEESEPQ